MKRFKTGILGRHHVVRALPGFFLLIPNTALAETLVHPSVGAVVEGGYWHENGVGDGRFRIVVVDQGFEHVSSRVVAEWKSDSTKTSDARILHAVELVKGGFYRIGMPKITSSEDGANVELEGVATYAPDTSVICRFNLAPGRKVTIIKACGD
ncbi:hypothetical protein HJA86_10565 [Rhizobium bangladeshense]|nr:hypothetical protein [Rhizobium bangladeshense]